MCGQEDHAPRYFNLGRSPPGEPGGPGLRAWQRDASGNFLTTCCAPCQLAQDVADALEFCPNLTAVQRFLSEALDSYNKRVLGLPAPPASGHPPAGARNAPPPPP